MPFEDSSRAGTGSPGREPRAGLIGLARESSLRQRIVARDEQALVELVDIATPWLLGIAQAMLHDRDEAEDVVMEAFRTVWDNITPASEPQSGLMPYLLRITRHRAIDRLRRRQRRVRKHSAAADAGWNSGMVPPPQVDEAGHPGWQVHTQIHRALAQLPAEQQMVVRLAYFEGLTHSEIAARLDIPLGTTKTRLRLAFTRLRTLLADLKDWLV